MDLTQYGRLQFLALIWLALALPASRADYYAAKNGQTPSYPYTTWASAANHIQDAVNAATNGATVWVGAGRYTLPPNFTNYIGSNVVYINRLLTLRSSNGIPETTVIDGEAKNRGVAVYYPAGSTVYRAVIDGVTFTNCAVTNYGGALLLDSANNVWTAVVQNCVFVNNKAVTAADGDYSQGGAIYNYNNWSAFGLTVSNCVFRANMASNSANYVCSQGGAAHLRHFGRQWFVNCLIESNTAGNNAGAIYHVYGKLEMDNCIVRGNRAERYLNAGSGGGAIMLNGLITARNCLFHDNSAVGGWGGAIACQRQGSGPTMVCQLFNCTVVSNSAGGAGGIYIRSWGPAQGYYPYLEVYNSIIQSNAGGNVAATAPPGMANSYICSCWYPTNNCGPERIEIGNITSPVSFVDFDNKDFRLASDSPAVNAGTNQDWMADYNDLDGHKRIRYGTVDAGAFELIKDATIYLFR